MMIDQVPKHIEHLRFVLSLLLLGIASLGYASSSSRSDQQPSPSAAQEVYQELRDSLGFESPATLAALQQWERTAMELKDSVGLVAARKETAYRFIRIGQVPEALAQYERVLDLLALTGDQLESAKINYNLGVLNYRLGNYPEATEFFNQAIAIYQNLPESQQLLSGAYQGIAAVYKSKGLYEKAYGYQKEALDIHYDATLLTNIGETLFNAREFDQAETYLLEAKELIERDPEKQQNYGNLLLNLGAVYMGQMRFAEARSTFDEALKINQVLQNPGGIALSYFNQADLEIQQENYAAAVPLLQMALAEYRQLDYKYELSNTLSSLALVYYFQDKLNKSQQLVDSALLIAEDIGASELFTKASRIDIAILHKKEGLDEAEVKLDTLMNVIQRQNNKEKNAQVAVLQAELDYEKQQQAIQNLENDRDLQAQLLRRQKIILFLLSIFLLGALFFAYYLNRLWRDKQKANVRLSEVNEKLAVAKENLEEANQDLATVNQQLRESNEQLDGYAHLVSHDLKEPLRGITSYAALLGRSLDKLNEDQKDFLEEIQNSARRMNKMVTAVLDYSTLGKNELTGKMVDLNGIIQHVETQLQTLIAEQQAGLTVDPLPQVFGDELLLTLVFQNLIANAIHYRQPHVPIQIHISGAAGQDLVEIRITDNGEGIPAQDRERIFQLFQRGEGKRRHAGGSGIGLATCQSIVKRHHGTIRVETAPSGQGSVFVVTLPSAPFR